MLSRTVSESEDDIALYIKQTTLSADGNNNQSNDESVAVDETM
jgi:hypothetical protein